MTGTADWPFRFYGEAPVDWFGDQHAFSVAFLAAPSSATREQIARLFAEFTASGPLGPAFGEPWLWSEELAHFAVEQRFGSPDEAGFMEPIRRFLRAVHAVAPIRDVLNMAARESYGAWESWSIAQGLPAAGAPGQVFPGKFSRVIDADRPPLAVDAVFEAAASEAAFQKRDEAELKRIEKVIERSKKSKHPIEPAGRAAVERDGEAELGPPLCWKDDHIELSEPSGAAQRVVSGPVPAERILHAAWLADRRMIVRTVRGLYLTRPKAGDEREAVAFQKLALGSGTVLVGGRLVVAHMGKGMSLFACVGERLQKLCTLAADLGAPSLVGGVLHFSRFGRAWRMPSAMVAATARSKGAPVSVKPLELPAPRLAPCEDEPTAQKKQMWRFRADEEGSLFRGSELFSGGDYLRSVSRLVWWQPATDEQAVVLMEDRASGARSLDWLAYRKPGEFQSAEDGANVVWGHGPTNLAIREVALCPELACLAVVSDDSPGVRLLAPQMDGSVRRLWPIWLGSEPLTAPRFNGTRLFFDDDAGQTVELLGLDALVAFKRDNPIPAL